MWADPILSMKKRGRGDAGALGRPDNLSMPEPNRLGSAQEAGSGPIGARKNPGHSIREDAVGAATKATCNS